MSVINTNIGSINAQRSLYATQSTLQTSLQRLSSGLRINSARDDAAGMAIATRMDTRIRGSQVAIRNANDGISMAQTAEGALGRVQESLQRMRELAVQARNATNGDSDKTALDQEFGELAKEVQRVIGATDFNGKRILAADAGTQTYQVGTGTATEDSIDVTTVNLRTETAITDVAGTDASGASRASITGDESAIASVITDIDAALEKVSEQRSLYGATQARFEGVIGALQQTIEATTAGKSRIMDADFAAETSNLTRAQILQQAGTAMLAQANSLPQNVLSLLRG